MTSREALAILTAPRFGDPQHIAAVKHLSDVEAAREAFGKCRHKKCSVCDGKGTIKGRSDLALCDWCGGDGKEDGCHCFTGLSADAVMEAKRK